MMRFFNGYFIYFFVILFLSACQVSTPGSNATLTGTRSTETSPTPTQNPTDIGDEKMETKNPPTSNMGDADVLFVSAEETADGTWTISVTVSHPDTGWDDYADGWDVMLPDGTVLRPDPASPFTRLLLHPHVNEQPFTRSQSGIEIPPGATELIVRAHDRINGFGGEVVTLDLRLETGERFEIVRMGALEE
jgi:hypothetical protein